MNNNLFEAFNNGFLKLTNKTVEFADIPWSKHPSPALCWLFMTNIDIPIIFICPFVTVFKQTVPF